MRLFSLFTVKNREHGSKSCKKQTACKKCSAPFKGVAFYRGVNYTIKCNSREKKRSSYKSVVK